MPTRKKLADVKGKATGKKKKDEKHEMPKELNKAEARDKLKVNHTLSERIKKASKIKSKKYI